jgi:hypothetical protein
MPDTVSRRPLPGEWAIVCRRQAGINLVIGDRKILGCATVFSSRNAGGAASKITSGHTLSFPIQGNARLENARETQLNEIELSPFGLHWPALDEDLSFAGIMRGDYGQR